jgi:hypothetical protein
MLFSRGARTPHATGRTPDVAAQRESAVGRFALPIYLTAVLFIVTPIVDAITNVWPVQLGNESWRFGFTGAAANYLVSAVFGITVLCLAAAFFVNRLVLRIGAVVALLSCLLLLALLADFLLAAISFRQLVPLEQMSSFSMGVGKATLKYLTATLVLFVTSFAAYKGQQSFRL